MTLRFKLLVLVAAVALFAATGVTAVALLREVEQSQERLSCQGAAAAASLAIVLSRPGGLPSAQPALEQALIDPALVRASLVDPAGQVMACADRTGSGCPRTPLPPAGALGFLGGAPFEASAPLAIEGKPAGKVRVSYVYDGLRGEARRLAASAAAVAAIWIALGMIFGSVLVGRITRPLTEVVRAADALAEGERIEVKLRTDPELTGLVGAFNRMSAKLREQRAERELLIATLNQRVAVATAEGLRAERLVTLGAIAAGFAHEMGNSLNVIAGFTGVVLRELPAGSPHHDDLEKVKREGARAGALLERFLFFARARSAKAAPEQVERMVREAVEVIGPAAATAHVETSVTIDPGLPPVKADAELMRQAFLNLCVNAVQAMEPRGGRLMVRACAREGGVSIEFSDTGPGVDPAVRDRIFEPFFTTKKNGTGLGLAIVRQAAEANGGTVQCESVVGLGTLFRVMLPAAAA